MPIFANEEEVILSFSHREILEDFFTHLIEDTAAGYAIYGEKPVYSGSFRLPETLMPGSLHHEKINKTFLALTTLQKDFSFSEKNCILLSKEKNFPDSRQFHLVNRKAFLQVVERNLPLFKYTLGWTTSPESALNQFLSFDPEIWEPTNAKPALQGILLGYGTDNAITYERALDFTENLFSPPMPDSPPNS